MPIHYALYENHLTSDPNDYAAQVEITLSAGLDEIVQRILSQGSSATEGDILLILTDAIKAVEGILLEGGRVNFGGLVDLYPRMIGVFDGPTDRYDPARHRVDVGAVPGNRVRQTVRANATVEKVEAVKPAPSLTEYVDLGTETTNQSVTPGGIGTINGHRLKYNPAEADEGIFFVGASTGTQTKVSAVQKNKPSQLVFLVPADLPGEDHYLEVRARMTNGTQLRTGRLDATLSG